MYLRRSFAGVGWVAGCAAVALATAACGSSSSASSSSKSATSPASGPSTTAASSSTSSASGVVSAAQKFVAPFEKPPTIGITTPLKAKPAAGKTIYVITGNLAPYAPEDAGITAAAKAIGWHIKLLTADLTNVTSVNTEMQTAVAAHPDFIANITGLSKSVYAPGLAAAKAANIPVFVELTLDPLGDGIVYRGGGPNEVLAAGKVLANWVIADSDGKADAAYFAIPTLPSLAGQEKSFQQTAAACTTCQLTTIPVSLSQEANGSVASTVVGYVQTHASVKYLVFAEGTLTTGVRQALNTAGLGKDVKLVTWDAGVANLQALKAGQEQMGLVFPAQAAPWYLVDAMARYSEGSLTPSLSDVDVPLQIFTPNSLPTMPWPWQGPPDYQQQFEKLWKVTS
jgi:hypothetical protein